MGDESIVDVVLQDDSIHAGFTEHVDILALLNLVGDVVDGRLFRLLVFVGGLILFLFSGSGVFRFGLCLGGISLCSFFFLHKILDGQVFAIEILVQDGVCHLFAKFAVLDTAKFDERADIIPVFFIILAVGLAHAGELVCDLLCDVVGDFLYKAVVLQGASGYVQRQIRAVDDTL